MNYYITYFYNVRFLPKNAIPLSTALFDPVWFHDGKGNKYQYRDKRGVWNGLRAEPLCSKAVHTIGEADCGKNCGQPIPCRFMDAYYNYLKSLDFLDIITRCNLIAKKAIPLEDGEPFIVLLVHEPSYCPCAERPVLQRWFRENGENLEEWNVKK